MDLLDIEVLNNRFEMFIPASTYYSADLEQDRSGVVSLRKSDDEIDDVVLSFIVK